MKCDFCGNDESLPFVCNYCGGAFCSDHRLPEAHQCKGDLTQKRTITAPPTTTFTWQTPSAPSPYPTTRQAKVFSVVEIRDIIIAWFALGVAFTFTRFTFFGGTTLDLANFSIYLGIALVTVGPGFVFHELSHKFVAQRYGFWAEFRMWPMGLVLALVTSLLGIIFAAPGATYISGANISPRENGRISIAGPLVNVVIGALFYPLTFSGSNLIFAIGFLGSYINIFLALFNLLPIGPLDGAKVWRWSKLIWVATFIPLLAVFFYLFLS
ncbi:MAG TPA: AN1-type zinc finger domain-containing protein [Nitrososphaerales archaeon]|nr:AN1-type zinc finger domain-containing protein [Nitrososphaerales archaeon]